MRPEVSVYRHGRDSGTNNTALDAKLLAEAGKGRLVVAFTEWEPTISLGRFQSDRDVDLEECARRGVEVVRRMTGGQAVGIDSSSIGFALAAPRRYFPPTNDEVKSGVCEAVASALNAYGVPARFAAPDYVVVPGKTSRPIANSAQVLSKGSDSPVLVHGSVLYGKPNPNLFELMRFEDESLGPHKELAVGALAYVQEFSSVSQEQLVDAMAANFAEFFGTKPTYRAGQLKAEGSLPPIHRGKSKPSVGACLLAYVGIDPRVSHLSAAKPGYAK